MKRWIVAPSWATDVDLKYDLKMLNKWKMPGFPEDAKLVEDFRIA